MKLSEVMVAWKCHVETSSYTHEVIRGGVNTTWESLQSAGADCFVPIGLVSTLMCNYIYGHESWIL